ncbi:hypothetical protein [Salinimicrobium flavum]|uniref:GLPGLI family protein n=1 Tax=Salinimicrobium flavum TaxID=1737065 RepID=A0ABW5IVW4_9FLAO
MKFTLLFLFLATANFSYSQFGEPYRATEIVLHSGDTLTGMGKTKNKGFKFRSGSAEKPYYIEYSAIDFIQQKFSGKEWKTFKFFQTNNSDKFIRVEELMVGGPLELYAIVATGNAAVAGGFSFPVTTVTNYLKKSDEEKLTEIGIYDPVFSDYTSKVKNYFSDCPKLLEQIENKKLRFRDGLEKMVEFYNNNCALE